MELYERLCKNCGGDLRRTEDGRYKCNFCGSIYETEAVVDYADEMKKLFDEMKLEAIANARRNLYEAAGAEHISNTRIHECCLILKQLLPEDFQANFYEVATGKNVRQITKAIRKINVEKNADYIESVILFLIRSLQTEYQLELNNLISRAFEYKDPAKFEHYCTLLASEAVKVDTGVYETKLPREVFIAYSSKDMEKVAELTEVLEAQGLKCFVAARNLRHGKGAVENYNAALEEAMDHCRALVFVSSTNSRSFNCDALTIELPYVQKKDLENAPAELRNNYKAIPQQYKKPRVEYRIGESTTGNVADTISNEIFDGYERAYSPEEVAERVMKQLVAVPILTSTTMQVFQQKIPNEISVGLEFKLNSDKKSYSVAGIGKCKDKRVVIPSKHEGKPIVSIDNMAFQSCLSLIEVFIPNSIKRIGINAFKECKNLCDVIFEEKSRCKRFALGSFRGCISLTNINVPKSVENIDKVAFNSCSRLMSVNFEQDSKCKSIGASAFSSCHMLESIILPESIRKIEQSAFYDCIMLTKVHLSPNVTKVAGFSGCINLRRITIPNGVTDIDNFAFYNCKNLIEVSLPHSIINIGEKAFSGCTNLRMINTPKELKTVSKDAFSDCINLKNIPTHKME